MSRDEALGSCLCLGILSFGAPQAGPFPSEEDVSDLWSSWAEIELLTLFLAHSVALAVALAVHSSKDSSLPRRGNKWSTGGAPIDLHPQKTQSSTMDFAVFDLENDGEEEEAEFRASQFDNDDEVQWEGGLGQVLSYPPV
jgi:hypothetical protein